MFTEYPLLVISKDKFYRDENTRKFIESDPHILAAYYFQEEIYNTVTVQFHEDLYSYETWSDKILEEGKIIKEEDRHPPDAALFSTKRILKYDPSAPFRVIERGFKRGEIQEIGGLSLDLLSINILKMVLTGKAIRTNENFLARTLDVHRNTIIRQIRSLLKNGIVSNPVSRFPQLLVPPDYMLIFSLVEIKRRCQEVEDFIRRDPHVPLMIKCNVGRYNYLVAGTFKTIEKHLEWQENYTQNFKNCIEAIKSTYLSPAMTFSINQNRVCLELIKKKLSMLPDEETIDFNRSKHENMT
ncbi:hypothetical protein CEE45_12005 [Candidatus Heimdallarchaeota archaeon B3_Heim]|nr:MAG: hypothetical protein CEE45_12005 [Candidatus Heimdallarchaeota archaeon B3_Heim]